MIAKKEIAKAHLHNLIHYIPPTQWDEYLSHINADTSLISAMSDDACSLALKAGELSHYLGHRGAFGSGDHGHDDAMKAMHKQRKKLRKALGYSYP